MLITETTDLIRPTIHLNGTSKEALMAALVGAIDAIRLAQAALAKTAPHGRDYYPQGPHEIDHAMSQHAARYVALDAVADELTSIATVL